MNPADKRARHPRCTGWVLILVLGFGVPGCSSVRDFLHLNSDQHGASPVKGRTKAGPPTQDASIEEIIVLMQQGRAQPAHKALQSFLKHHPKDPVATDLLRQMDQDPVAYFGVQYRIYKVKPGDSLAGIAGRLLHDDLKFYALARYNDIRHPGQLAVGQELKIPTGESSRGRARKGAGPGARVSVRMAEAKGAMMVSDYERVIDLLRDGNGRSKAETNLLGRAYKRLVQAHLQLNRLDSAQNVVSDAELRQPKDGRWGDWLVPIAAEVRGRMWQQRGVKALKDKDREQALNDFANAVSFQPKLQPATEQYARLKKELVNEYHESALLLYRRQKLDEAIKLWDRVLTIDPEFSHARSYRARAVELKKRILALDALQAGTGGK